jgi:hypothetical protein
MDLDRRLGDQEQPAGDQHQVLPGELDLQHGEGGLRQRQHPGDRGQQREPHDHGEPEAEPARDQRLVLRQPAGDDRDEDQVVDPEDDLECDQGREADPVAGSANGTSNMLPAPRRGNGWQGR